MAFIILFSLMKISYAQQQPPEVQTPVRRELKLNLNEAIKIALQNNPGLMSAHYSVEQQDVLGKTAFDLGKTSIYYYKDNTPPSGNYEIGISQTISFPTVYLQQNSLQNQNISLSKKSYEAVKADLIKNVKLAYYQYAYGFERLKLFSYQDSIYGNFLKAAEVRYKTGETTNLEKLIAETKYQEVQLQMKQAGADLSIYEKELQKYLNTNLPIKLKDTTLELIRFDSTLVHTRVDTTTVKSNPLINLYKQKINVAEAEYGLEVNRLLPDISLGYSKLTDNSIFNYYSFQVGVSLPLCFLPQQGRIEAAAVGEKIAESGYQNFRILIQSAYQQQLKEFQKWKEQIDYYKTIGSEQADEILKAAEANYGNGNIGYVEFVQSISQAIDIKTKYLDAINQYDKSIINLNYLLGIE